MIAFGQLKLMPNQFDILTYRQFTNAVNGHRMEKDYESRERFVQMRKIMWAVINVQSRKSISESEIITFPWESDMIEKIEREYDETYLEELEKSKEFWDKIDSKVKKV
jgi:hypothetical protein